MGGGPTAQHVCRAHVRLDTHANTQTHAHVRIHTHVAIPCVLVVPCAACRPCHRLSCMSLPCVQRCHAAMLALRPRSTCVDAQVHAHTHTHTCVDAQVHVHTHTLRHSLRPRRSLRRLSSLSLPVLLVTAIRPSCVAHTAVCSAAMLPCLLSVRAAVVLRGPRSVEMPAVADDDADRWMDERPGEKDGPSHRFAEVEMGIG